MAHTVDCPPKGTRRIAAARGTTLRGLSTGDKRFTRGMAPRADADPLPFAVMAFNHRELEESITHLESVDAARVVSEGPRVTEVHVIAAPGKPAKQVVRDVQSLAMASRTGRRMKYAVMSTNTNRNDRIVACSSFGSILVAALIAVSWEFAQRLTR